MISIVVLVLVIVPIITRPVIIIVPVIMGPAIIIVSVLTGPVIIMAPGIIWFVRIVSWSRSLFSMPVMGSKQKDRSYSGEDCDYCNTCCLVIPMIIFGTVGICC